MNDANMERLLAEASQAIETGDWEQAIGQLEKALQADPQNARMLYMLGCAHGEQGNIQEAITAYESSAEHAGEMAVNPLYNLANLYKEMNDLPNAVTTYNRVLEIDPTMGDAWINMGCILDDAGMHDQALLCYDSAVPVAGEDPMLWANRGNSLRSLQRFEEAEESYGKALQLDRSDLASTIGLGACQVERGDPVGLELLEQAYGVTRHPMALFELATALAKLDRYADAVDCFELLAQQGEESPSLRNNLGECLAKLDRVDEALASFDKAIESDAEFEAAYFGKARLLNNLGRAEEARPVVEQLLSVASDEFKAQPAVRALVTMCSLDQ